MAMKSYIVVVFETRVLTYRVAAGTPEAARESALNGDRLVEILSIDEDLVVRSREEEEE